MSKYTVGDAHLHLWEKQNGRVNGRPVVGVGNGKSDFGGEVRQMMPPYMEDDKNTVERLIANMDYACVAGCVVTQEYIDGNQDAYLLSAKAKYP
ncbi:MAG: amidohydrolase, partial [Lachnospiraceae bacterium]|nr:amidohydrolase [Lachnospiraceae bacterium]